MNIEQLKAEKKRLGLTFDQLSEISGIPKKTLSNIFRGLTPNPRIDTVQAIEQALGIENALPQGLESEETKNAPSALTSAEGAFVQNYGHLFNDMYFNRYAKIYSLLNQEQRIYIYGVIVGTVEQFGITYRDIG